MNPPFPLVRASLIGLAACLLSAPVTALADPSPSGSGAVLAQSGPYQLTAKDMDDILTFDGGVLETPLGDADLAAARDNIAGQFRANPQGFTKSLAIDHAYAETIRNGPPYEREQLIWTLRSA